MPTTARDVGLPDIFCWTKMGTEAGQTLDAILQRKELERKVGNGVFAWGIGNSLGSSPDAARRATFGAGVDILFSPMKSAPKAIDCAPSTLVLWLGYHSKSDGLVDLPDHMLITSRSNSASGTEKRTHYALLCERHEEIKAESSALIIDAGCARNLVSLNPLGASQVTAMVSYGAISNSGAEKPYPVSFRARMHREGFVRLGSPVPLTGSLLAAYKDLCKISEPQDWLRHVAELKSLAKNVTSK